MASPSGSHYAERNDNEQDSQNSSDQTISHADELFLTDETDSSPDKNFEIKRLNELSSPIPLRRGSVIPSITLSEYVEPGLASTPNIPFSMGSVLMCREMSPIGPSSSPPSQFSLETNESQLQTLNHWSSAPDVRNVSFFSKPVLPIRSLSNPPGTCLCSTSENAQNRNDPTSFRTTEKASSPMSISTNIDQSLGEFASFSSAAYLPLKDASSPFNPAAVSSPTDISMPISSSGFLSSIDFSTAISPVVTSPSISPDITELLEKLSISEPSEQVDKILAELLDELSPQKKCNSPQ